MRILKEMSRLINTPSMNIGEFFALLQILGIGPELRTINDKGEYRDRYRKNLDDPYAIQLDVAIRSRLKEYPLEELSYLIWHMKSIVADAEAMHRFLVQNGVYEDNNGTHGFDTLEKNINKALEDQINLDPFKFRTEIANLYNLGEIRRQYRFGKNFADAVESAANEALQK